MKIQRRFFFRVSACLDLYSTTTIIYIRHQSEDTYQKRCEACVQAPARSYDEIDELIMTARNYIDKVIVTAQNIVERLIERNVEEDD